MDMQTDVERSAGFAEVVRALVASHAAPDEPYDRDLYGRRRAQASLAPPDPAEVDALTALVDAALDLAARPLAEALLTGRPEAERQLAVAASDGIAGVPADVAERTLAF